MSQTTTTGDPTTQEPISSIVDGWWLKSGELYLIVKCKDGVERPTKIKLERHVVKFQ